MLQSLTANKINPVNDSLISKMTFTLANSDYIVKDISGLGPVKATVSTIDVPSQAGGVFLNSKDTMRNIVLRLGFGPDRAVGGTVTQLRSDLYKVFMPGSKVSLEFMTDHMGLMKIKGYVESNEPSIFAQEPEIIISIICPKPYFKGTAGAKTFIANRLLFPTITLPFEGLVPVGFKLTFTMESAKTNLAIFSKNAPGDYFLSLYMTLNANDVVTFSSVEGNRYAQYIRSSATYDAIGMFRGSLTDAKLYQGPNTFTFNDGDWTKGNVIFEYEILYGAL